MLKEELQKEHHHLLHFGLFQAHRENENDKLSCPPRKTGNPREGRVQQEVPAVLQVMPAGQDMSTVLQEAQMSQLSAPAGGAGSVPFSARKKAG